MNAKMILALVVSSVCVFARAEEFCVFSSHPCTITRTDSSGANVPKEMSFTNSSEPTGGYRDSSDVSGMTTCTRSQTFTYTASPTTDRQRFLGWYGLSEARGSNDDPPKVSAVTVCLTENAALGDSDIGKAMTFRDYHLVMAKYISRWKVSFIVSPEGSGQVTGVTSGTFHDEGTDVTLSASANAGYSFCRWEDNSTASSRTLAKIGVDASLTAYFTGNVYTVTFDANGGTTDTSVKSVTHADAYGDLPTPSWTSHTFLGWFTEKEGGTEVKADTVVALTSDQRLYAHWKADSFTVVFQDAEQFGLTELKTESVEWGKSATPPDNPQHPGWTFDHWTGWGSGQNDFADVKQNRTYTAIGHNNKYTVRYHANDGTIDYSDETFTCYESKALAADLFKRTGYEFAGWGKEAETSPEEPDYVASAVVTDLATFGTVDLYALWRPIRYQVAFDANGGHGEMTNQVWRYDQAYEVPDCTFTKAGGQFSAWEIVNATSGLTICRPGEMVSNLTSVAGQVVTLKANWRGFYTVAFAANGGEGTMTNVVFERDVDCQLPSNRFSRTGYVFEHWTAGATDFADGATVRNLAEVGETNVLSAVWTANRYTVRFNSNPPQGIRPTGTMDDVQLTYDQSSQLPANEFNCTEIWKFNGWSNTVSGAVYADEATVSNLCAEPDGLVVLNALWTLDVGDLSEAMGCLNLKWVNDTEGNAQWKVMLEKGNPMPCVGHAATSVEPRMHAKVNGLGTLAFDWRPQNEEEVITVKIIAGEGLATEYYSKDYSVAQFGTWNNRVTYELPSNVDFSQPVHIVILNWADYCPCESYIDNMTWTPAKVEPTPGEAVAPTAAGVSGDVFSLTIPTADGMDYGVWTNADVTAPLEAWGLMETKTATGSSLDFSLPILPGVPQLFFRAFSVE